MAVSAASRAATLNVNTPQVNGNSPISSPDSNNRLIMAVISYDNAGNMNALNTFSGISYDAENRLTAETSNGTYTYQYDGNGRRVAKTGGGDTTIYVYDAAGLLTAEYDATPQSAQCTCYLSTDHLGSVRLVTDGSGQIISRHDYLPFGEEIIGGYAGRTPALGFGAAEGVTQRFTGKERDSESGLDYFGARYYRNALGRFTSPDWAAKAEPVPYAELDNPQSLNLYAYVGNNPLRYTAPTGHYKLNNSGCGDNAKCQKKWNKAADKFEKQRAKDLNSKNAGVRAAAAAYGARGEAKGVHLGFGNLNTGANPIYGSVDPSGSTPGNVNIQVTLDFGRAGNAETQTHERTHVGDDEKFLNSYDPAKGGYDQSLNPTHGHTEFNAFKAGAAINQEHCFGPNDDQKILNFLHASPTYGPIFNVPVLNPAQFPGPTRVEDEHP